MKNQEPVYQIKPLVWVEQADPEHWRAESVVGTLDLRAVGWYWFLRIHGDACGHFGTDIHGAKLQAWEEYCKILRRALIQVQPAKKKARK